MKTRILTSIAITLTLVIMFVLKIYVSPFFFDAFFMVVAGVAAYEISKLLSRCGLYNNIYLSVANPMLITLATLLGIIYNLGFGYVILINLAIIVFLALVTFIWQLSLPKQTKKEIKVRNLKPNVALFSFKKALNTTISLIYPTFLFLFMIFINHLDEIAFGKIDNFGGIAGLVMLIFALLIPIFTDTFAMLTGMLIGGKKLAPKVSPNKTISGSIGGTLFCVLLSACVYLIFGSIDFFAAFVNNFEIWKLIIIVFVGSVVAQFGDLIESFIKRKASVKDSGKALPGHGGMLDRIDSYILVAPLVLLAFCFVLI